MQTEAPRHPAVHQAPPRAAGLAARASDRDRDLVRSRGPRQIADESHLESIRNGTTLLVSRRVTWRADGECLILTLEVTATDEGEREETSSSAGRLGRDQDVQVRYLAVANPIDDRDLTTKEVHVPTPGALAVEEEIQGLFVRPRSLRGRGGRP